MCIFSEFYLKSVSLELTPLIFTLNVKFDCTIENYQLIICDSQPCQLSIFQQKKIQIIPIIHRVEKELFYKMSIIWYLWKIHFLLFGFPGIKWKFHVSIFIADDLCSPFSKEPRIAMPPWMTEKRMKVAFWLLSLKLLIPWIYLSKSHLWNCEKSICCDWLWPLTSDQYDK